MAPLDHNIFTIFARQSDAKPVPRPAPVPPSTKAAPRPKPIITDYASL